MSKPVKQLAAATKSDAIQPTHQTHEQHLLALSPNREVNNLHPQPLLMDPEEIRSNEEALDTCNDVMDLWEDAFPMNPLPELEFSFLPIPNYPFAHTFIAKSCYFTPMILPLSPKTLRNMFLALTPAFYYNQQKVEQNLEACYYSKRRFQFTIAKALAEHHLGHASKWHIIKMKILKLSPRRWKQAFVKQHMDSDFMAASIQKDISLGGVEHLSKLHAFHCNYKQDINKDDDALVAETRLVNLLLTTKKLHSIEPMEALRTVLDPRASLTGYTADIINHVEEMIDRMGYQHFLTDEEQQQYQERQLREKERTSSIENEVLARRQQLQVDQPAPYPDVDMKDAAIPFQLKQEINRSAHPPQPQQPQFQV